MIARQAEPSTTNVGISSFVVCTLCTSTPNCVDRLQKLKKKMCPNKVFSIINIFQVKNKIRTGQKTNEVKGESQLVGDFVMEVELRIVDHLHSYMAST